MYQFAYPKQKKRLFLFKNLLNIIAKNLENKGHYRNVYMSLLAGYIKKEVLIDF